MNTTRKSRAKKAENLQAFLATENTRAQALRQVAHTQKHTHKQRTTRHTTRHTH